MKRILTILGAGVAAALAFGLARADTGLVVRDILAKRPATLDAVLERRLLRLAVPRSPLFLAFDGRRMVGLSVERARALEDWFRERHGRQIDVALLPLPRGRMLPMLEAGRIDAIDAGLAITRERDERVDFTVPLREDVREIVVTGPAAPPLRTIDDLAATGLSLRPSSGNLEHIRALNAERRAVGRSPVPVEEVDGTLDDRDILDGLERGSIAATVVDDHEAALWAELHPGIELHEDLAIHRGGQVAWAVQEDADALRDTLSDFVRTAREGTLLGNVLDRRYLADAGWVDRVEDGRHRKAYEAARRQIERHAHEHALDPLLVVAQAFRESRFDASARSAAGAVGVMQLLPSTAREVGVDDISTTAANVHAGVRYLVHLEETYLDDPGIGALDRQLLALAGYNAGPGHLREARERAARMGLDPDVWFENVETAMRHVVGSEPVIYVRDIYRNAAAMRLAEDDGRLAGSSVRAAALSAAAVGRSAPPPERSSVAAREAAAE